MDILHGYTTFSNINTLQIVRLKWTGIVHTTRQIRCDYVRV